MARRPRLTEAGVLGQAQPDLGAKRSRTGPPRARKAPLAFWVDPATSTQLRVAAATMGRSVQDIMVEALDDWFTKRGQRAA